MPCGRVHLQMIRLKPAALMGSRLTASGCHFCWSNGKSLVKHHQILLLHTAVLLLFVRIPSCKKVVIGVFARLLNHSLHHPHILSHHPAAAGARFKLLTLALRYCEFFAVRIPDCVPVAVLYERIIRAGLAW